MHLYSIWVIEIFDYLQEHPRKLIPQLCKQFYHLGWVTGTGGGISIKNEWVYSCVFHVRRTLKETKTGFESGWREFPFASNGIPEVKEEKNEQKDSEKQFWRSKTESFAKMLFQMICDTFRVISN